MSGSRLISSIVADVGDEDVVGPGLRSSGRTEPVRRSAPLAAAEKGLSGGASPVADDAQEPAPFRRAAAGGRRGSGSAGRLGGRFGLGRADRERRSRTGGRIGAALRPPNWPSRRVVEAAPSPPVSHHPSAPKLIGRSSGRNCWHQSSRRPLAAVQSAEGDQPRKMPADHAAVGRGPRRVGHGSEVPSPGPHRRVPPIGRRARRGRRRSDWSRSWGRSRAPGARGPSCGPRSAGRRRPCTFVKMSGKSLIRPLFSATSTRPSGRSAKWSGSSGR